MKYSVVHYFWKPKYSHNTSKKLSSQTEPYLPTHLEDSLPPEIYRVYQEGDDMHYSTFTYLYFFSLVVQLLWF